MYKHLLVPTDGSALSRIAVENALHFAREVAAKVTVLTVIEPFKVLSVNPEQLQDTHEEYDRHCNLEANRILDAARQAAEAAGVRCETSRVKSNDPAQAIVDAAAKGNCDLIAMSSHGREGFKAFMIGSVTMKVLAHTKIPVLVYRH